MAKVGVKESISDKNWLVGRSYAIVWPPPTRPVAAHKQSNVSRIILATPRQGQIYSQTPVDFTCVADWKSSYYTRLF